jgi:hypothetical protein
VYELLGQERPDLYREGHRFDSDILHKLENLLKYQFNLKVEWQFHRYCSLYFKALVYKSEH